MAYLGQIYVWTNIHIFFHFLLVFSDRNVPWLPNRHNTMVYPCDSHQTVAQPFVKVDVYRPFLVLLYSLLSIPKYSLVCEQSPIYRNKIQKSETSFQHLSCKEHFVYSETCLNRSLNKPKTCLNQTDFTVPSTVHIYVIWTCVN